uniref:Uncharacterized protein n=1 Tax=Anguilla anguilla TaxID=7936 RepID=A0A0E9Q3C5_ANGAN
MCSVCFQICMQLVTGRINQGNSSPPGRKCPINELFYKTTAKCISFYRLFNTFHSNVL